MVGVALGTDVGLYVGGSSGTVQEKIRNKIDRKQINTMQRTQLAHYATAKHAFLV
jgi:hypothetical protein